MRWPCWCSQHVCVGYTRPKLTRPKLTQVCLMRCSLSPDALARAGNTANAPPRQRGQSIATIASKGLQHRARRRDAPAAASQTGGPKGRLFRPLAADDAERAPFRVASRGGLQAALAFETGGPSGFDRQAGMGLTLHHVARATRFKMSRACVYAHGNLTFRRACVYAHGIATFYITAI